MTNDAQRQRRLDTALIRHIRSFNSEGEDGLEPIRRLVEEGADVRGGHRGPLDSNRPIIEATEKGLDAVVEWLLDHGESPDPGKDTPDSPLVSACSRGHVNLVRLFLERGANPYPRRRDPISGQEDTPDLLGMTIHSPIMSAQKKAAILELLIVHGRDPNLPGEGAIKGKTAYEIARDLRAHPLIEIMRKAESERQKDHLLKSAPQGEDRPSTSGPSL